MSPSQHYFDPAGQFLGVPSNYSMVWQGGRLLSVYGSDTEFNHVNHLGSTSAWTNHAGTPTQDIQFFPWGDVWQQYGSGGYSFADMPYYDTSTDNVMTMFRMYSASLGRWHSPDPLGGDISNPQSLNRYSYVMNNHMSGTDPMGLDGEGSATVCDPDSGWYWYCSQNECEFGMCIPPLGPPSGGTPGGQGGAPPSQSGSSGNPGAEAFIDLPCITDISGLIPWINLGLIRLFGNAGNGPIKPAAGPNNGVVGGAQVFTVPDITPTQDYSIDVPKIHGPGSQQVYFPVPDKPTGDGSGMGNILHVEFDPVYNGAGQVTSITNIQAHFDIQNPYKGHAANSPLHLGADVLLARFLSRYGCGRGPVKFD